MTDWQKLVEFMHDPKTQEPEAEEQGETQQAA